MDPTDNVLMVVQQAFSLGLNVLIQVVLVALALTVVRPRSAPAATLLVISALVFLFVTLTGRVVPFLMARMEMATMEMVQMQMAMWTVLGLVDAIGWGLVIGAIYKLARQARPQEAEQPEPRLRDSFNAF